MMKQLHTTEKVCLAMWFLALVLTPFYVFGREPVGLITNNPEPVSWSPKVESGVPQPADYLLLSLMALVFGSFGLCFLRRMYPIAIVFALFTTYVVIVNFFWGLQLNDLSIIKNSLFYVFNFSLLATFLVLYARVGEGLLKVTMHAVAAAAFLQTILSPLVHVESWERQLLFFNNENQLGYYALLSATLFAAGTRSFPVNGWYQAAFYLAISYLAVLSLSKAAIYALALLYVLLFLQRPNGISALVLVAVLAFIPILAPDIVERIDHRFATAQKGDGFMARGYDRLGNHPEYLFFGAGEGDYSRFLSQLASELHSSYGTVLFCYGLVGAILFTYGLYLICSKPRLNAVLLLIPVFIYGTAHHGLRFRLFWVLLAFLSCMRKTSQAAEAAPAPDPTRTGRDLRQTPEFSW